MKKTVTGYSFIAFVFAFFPLAAMAAGTATINMGDASGTLSWQSPEILRVEMGDGEGYMLMRDGKVYIVNTAPEDGMPPVLEISGALQGMLEDHAGINDPELFINLPQQAKEFKKTGKQETLAGIRGEVYAVTLTNAAGATETMEMVLSDHPLAVELTDVLLGFNIRGIPMGQQISSNFKNALPGKMRGLLRVDNGLIVQSLDKKAPSASNFELPAEPVSMGELMQQMMQQVPGWNQ